VKRGVRLGFTFADMKFVTINIESLDLQHIHTRLKALAQAEVV
jgi:hypothetical protein